MNLGTGHRVGIAPTLIIIIATSTYLLFPQRDHGEVARATEGSSSVDSGAFSLTLNIEGALVAGSPITVTTNVSSEISAKAVLVEVRLPEPLAVVSGTPGDYSLMPTTEYNIVEWTVDQMVAGETYEHTLVINTDDPFMGWVHAQVSGDPTEAGITESARDAINVDIGEEDGRTSRSAFLPPADSILYQLPDYPLTTRMQFSSLPSFNEVVTVTLQLTSTISSPVSFSGTLSLPPGWTLISGDSSWLDAFPAYGSKTRIWVAQAAAVAHEWSFGVDATVPGHRGYKIAWVGQTTDDGFPYLLARRTDRVDSGTSTAAMDLMYPSAGASVSRTDATCGDDLAVTGNIQVGIGGLPKPGGRLMTEVIGWYDGIGGRLGMYRVMTMTDEDGAFNICLPHRPSKIALIVIGTDGWPWGGGFGDKTTTLIRVAGGNEGYVHHWIDPWTDVPPTGPLPPIVFHVRDAWSYGDGVEIYPEAAQAATHFTVVARNFMLDRTPEFNPASSPITVFYPDPGEARNDRLGEISLPYTTYGAGPCPGFRGAMKGHGKNLLRRVYDDSLPSEALTLGWSYVWPAIMAQETDECAGIDSNLLEYYGYYVTHTKGPDSPRSVAAVLWDAHDGASVETLCYRPVGCSVIFRHLFNERVGSTFWDTIWPIVKETPGSSCALRSEWLAGPYTQKVEAEEVFDYQLIDDETCGGGAVPTSTPVPCPAADEC